MRRDFLKAGTVINRKRPVIMLTRVSLYTLSYSVHRCLGKSVRRREHDRASTIGYHHKICKVPFTRNLSLKKITACHRPNTRSVLG